MSLLKKLQKKKKREMDSIKDVLNVSENPSLSSTFFKSDIIKRESEDSLILESPRSSAKVMRMDELLNQETANDLKAITSLDKDISLKKTKSKNLNDLEVKSIFSDSNKDTPPWLKNVYTVNPQVEMLIPEARRKLNEVLSNNDGEVDIDFSEVVTLAVNLASQSLKNKSRFTKKDLEQAESELYSLLTAKGPLQELYEDELVTDIFIDNHKSIKVIRQGHTIEAPFCFRSAEEYKLFIASMLQTVDRSLNMSSPIVDCVLDDKWRSRVNAIDASVIEGKEPKLAIRVPRLQQVSFYDVLQTRTLPPTLAAWLSDVVASGKINILVMGVTGSGKTVMTTALLSSVPSDERIITIEDVPEIFVSTSHMEKLVSRPPNAQGEGEVKMPELLRAALRRAPHRIVVGEIRDEESKLFLKALETGHSGSIATLHSNSVKNGLWRLLDLVSSYESSPQNSIMRRIGRSVHLVILMRRINNRPCLVELAEVLPSTEDSFKVSTIVKYKGIEDDKREWELVNSDSPLVSKMKKEGALLNLGSGLKKVKREK